MMSERLRGCLLLYRFKNKKLVYISSDLTKEYYRYFLGSTIERHGYVPLGTIASQLAVICTLTSGIESALKL